MFAGLTNFPRFVTLPFYCYLFIYSFQSSVLYKLDIFLQLQYSQIAELKRCKR